jgi:anti-sigma regulatory factor (Ser/Thr protein kinase)
VEVEHRLPVQPNAPMLARQQLGRVLKPVLHASRLQDVHLAVSELVTNAVLNGRANGADTIGITIKVDETFVRVAVQQPAPLPHPSRERKPSGTSLSEVILDHVTDRWGTDPGPPPHAWFEVDRRRLPRRSA